MTAIAFAAALIALAYTFVGYPALIWALARMFARAVRRSPWEPRIAIVVVARNEAARIVRKIDTCLGQDYPKDKLRIVIASDGSDDGMNALVESYADRGVTLLAFPARRGKAACLNDAVAACDGEIVVLTDARQRLDRLAIRFLVENFADPMVGAASGELVFETAGITEFGEGVDAYWRYEKFIRQQESRVHSVVGMTGAICAVRRECYRPIPANTILDDVVIPMNVVMGGRRVVFENRALAFDMPAREQREEKRRKVRTIAGNYQLLFAHPAFFVPLRNPIFFQLVSHKMARLLAPFFMALLLATNVALAPGSAVFQCLLAAQLLAYALPAIGLLSPAARRWRIVKVATAFLVLNWFAVLGLVEFLRNRDSHLWESKNRPAGGDSRGQGK